MLDVPSYVEAAFARHKEQFERFDPTNIPVFAQSEVHLTSKKVSEAQVRLTVLKGFTIERELAYKRAAYIAAEFNVENPLRVATAEIASAPDPLDRLGE